MIMSRQGFGCAVLGLFLSACSSANTHVGNNVAKPTHRQLAKSERTTCGVQPLPVSVKGDDRLGLVAGPFIKFTELRRKVMIGLLLTQLVKSDTAAGAMTAEKQQEYRQILEKARAINLEIRAGLEGERPPYEFGPVAKTYAEIIGILGMIVDISDSALMLAEPLIGGDLETSDSAVNERLDKLQHLFAVALPASVSVDSYLRSLFMASFTHAELYQGASGSHLVGLVCLSNGIANAMVVALEDTFGEGKGIPARRKGFASLQSWRMHFDVPTTVKLPSFSAGVDVSTERIQVIEKANAAAKKATHLLSQPLGQLAYSESYYDLAGAYTAFGKAWDQYYHAIGPSNSALVAQAK